MKRLSFMAAAALPLALSPFAVTAASAGADSVASPALKVTKPLDFVHRDDEARCEDHSLAAQARRGAFLEMTSVAP